MKRLIWAALNLLVGVAGKLQRAWATDSRALLLRNVTVVDIKHARLQPGRTPCWRVP